MPENELVPEYPKAWAHLDTGAEPIAIGGELVPVIDPEVKFVVLVLEAGGRQWIARESHDKLGPTVHKEDKVNAAVAAGFLIELPRVDWPAWLVSKVNKALGPS
jgi:hypothetical protein